MPAAIEDISGNVILLVERPVCHTWEVQSEIQKVYPVMVCLHCNSQSVFLKYSANRFFEILNLSSCVFIKIHYGKPIIAILGGWLDLQCTYLGMLFSLLNVQYVIIVSSIFEGHEKTHFV